ncbi:protein of unknown function DUF125 transmembrane [Ignisphaera aggregans DSM 17230]|uniref:Uncharacterized protein n=1 Tax=Ignisphaera aggregans (strain DSM 17230 / JCM 13409 / AQ1.S1) TaxID=583356 RepID=E0SPP5_IGNAA|nr:protein of unknown function DUF125 transmembrane [Ignisphaera aggregans DSM 17230]
MNSVSLSKQIRDICLDEYKAYSIYRALSRIPIVNRKIRTILEKASEDEYRHYMFWKKLSNECRPRFTIITGFIWSIILILFGVTVVLKLLELKERDASSVYREVLERYPDFGKELEDIIIDEERHEKEFLENIDEVRIRYLGSIALGISDALVELTGVYAGGIGAFANTLSAGIAGLLAGISAAISMAIASYAQAKHEAGKDPRVAAMYTGSAYFIVVILLAIPYFTIKSIVIAFSISIAIAVMVIAYMSFYSYVIYHRKYLREFLESTALLLGVSIVLYIAGKALGYILGISID